MSLVYFTSDLHLGHDLAAEKRGFSSLAEHDDGVIDSFWQAGMTKRDKLFVLGDIAMSKMGLLRIKSLPTVNVVVLLGNHDVLGSVHYLYVFKDIIGPITYRSFWLTHIPMHEQEIFTRKGNIHGHIHKDGLTGDLPLPWYNVNWDYHRGPVLFTDIEEVFDGPEAAQQQISGPAVYDGGAGKGSQAV